LGFLTAIPLLLNLVLVLRTRRFRLHFYFLVLIVILIPFYWSASFGGFNINGSNLWASFLPLLIVVLVSDRRVTIRWFLVYASLVFLSGFLDPYFDIPENIRSSLTFDNVFTTLAAATMILLTINYYKREKNSAQHLLALEQEKSENLLLNMLPKEIAEILKAEERIIAEHFDEASILFADLVGFTPMTAQMEPTEMVGLLNEIFSSFDSIVETYGAEKIRTIGDNYMLATGVPNERRDHAQAITDIALEMQAYIHSLPSQNGKKIDFRIGINSGPLVAGVIGHKKFQYDLWGDTVNIASRMESQGAPGRIQVTKNTYALLKDEFTFEARGRIDVKGIGEMETWFLIGRNDKSHTRRQR